MEWIEIYEELNKIKVDFDKSYKSLSQNRPIHTNTVKKHSETLVNCFNQARILIHEQKEQLNQEHWSRVSKFLIRLRSNLISVKLKLNLDIYVPTILNTSLTLETSETDNDQIGPEEQETNVKLEEEDLNNLTIPAVLMSDLDNSTDSDSSPSNNRTMAQTNIEFINTATKLIPAFDGKAENLNSFIDALEILRLITGEHEELAVSIVKSRLKGVARNLVGNETTITEVISKLKSNVKGETVEVLSAKLMNLQQRNKTANQYTVEVEQLTKMLECAYITDGLPLELARSYSTQNAVKAMTKNCTIDKVKLIMQAGTFNTMNEAVSKFVNSCTEATGQQNTVLYYRNNSQRGGNRGHGNYRGNFRSRFNNYSNNNYNNQYYNGRGQYRGNSRGRGNSNRSQNYNNPSNVRVTNNTSGNSQSPLNTQQ
ncbi:myb-like protein P isoform X1 [Drosophila yakuba]|uniref:myb-like protein P isoform X1 n=1 Tax=Drosophila yakuba TaxID=7245 RepID=UPI00193080AB|nr:myb-like protein P isoform X1 [Drosophila yakuba]